MMFGSAHNATKKAVVIANPKPRSRHSDGMRDGRTLGGERRNPSHTNAAAMASARK